MVIWAIDYDCYHRYQKHHTKSNKIEGQKGCKNTQECNKKLPPNFREDPDHDIERNITCRVDTSDGIDDSRGGEEREDRRED